MVALNLSNSVIQRLWRCTWGKSGKHDVKHKLSPAEMTGV